HFWRLGFAAGGVPIGLGSGAGFGGARNVELKRAKTGTDDGALDDILQLPDIARPVIFPELPDLACGCFSPDRLKRREADSIKSAISSAMSSLRSRNGGT